MKIELQVKGKEVVFPEFDIFLDNEDNIYLIGMKISYYKNLSNEINSKNSRVSFSENNLILELSKQYYYFNIEEYSNSINKDSQISFVFLKENGDFITEETKIFNHLNSIDF